MKDDLIDYILKWSQIVEVQNSLFYFDKAKYSEKFFAEVFNYLFQANLSDLNKLRDNFEAIDLGDTEKKLCFQITSSYKKTKIDDTIKMFFDHKLEDSYKRLIIFFICDNKDRAGLNCSVNGIDVEIMTLHQLFHDVEALPTGRQKELLNLLVSEFDISPIKQREAFWRLRMRHQYPITLKLPSGDDTSAINLFFTNNIVTNSFNETFRSCINNLVRELSENVSRHGKPSKPEIEIRISHQQIIISDWGTEKFDLQTLVTTDAKDGKNNGSFYFQQLKRLLRGQVHIHRKAGDTNTPNVIVFNFDDHLHELNVYEECCVWEFEMNDPNIINGCDFVYLMPETEKNTSQSRDQIVGFEMTLKPGFKPAIALFEADKDKAPRLKARFPNMPIKIVERVKTPKKI